MEEWLKMGFYDKMKNYVSVTFTKLTK